MTPSRAYQALKNVYHFLQAHLWRAWYGFPDRALTLYGITGTNGKTTTSYILRSILAAQYGEEKVGMLTTVVFRIGSQEILNETKMTTLPSRLVFSYLQQMKHAGVTHAVLEMTSHALDQNRLAGIRLAGAIILNIEREHLDYHKTMEEYVRAKLCIRKYLKPKAPLIVKGDDGWIKKGLAEFPISNFQFPILKFTTDQAKEIKSSLEGDANKENVLAARMLAEAAGVSSAVTDAGVAAVTHVPGRMEWLETDQGFRIVIDYAVTPDALERLYSYVRSIAKGRVLALLGAAGLRDRGKRPDMARAVAKYADVLVLTREDPWTESEEQIFQDLEKGLVNTKVDWKRIIDRREALRYLLQQAGPDDVVVVTGKGAERGMGVGKEVIPWNDREVILDLLSEFKQ